jgi:hypothetical protein
VSTSPAADIARQVLEEQDWNKRVAIIRTIPETFGKAQHQAIYASVAESAYVSDLAPDFAYVHWRDEYELSEVQAAYDRAFALTNGFNRIAKDVIASTLEAEPKTLLIFRLLLGFIPRELAASTGVLGAASGRKQISASRVKTIESGRPIKAHEAADLAAVIDRAMSGSLFPAPVGILRGKIAKPDTAEAWKTVQEYAARNVPFSVFLHQRHYGGAFRQLLDATSGKRGDLLEDAVEELFRENRIGFVRTGSSNQKTIATRFGLTVKPAPDFVVQDASGTLRAILECKKANDGGTARDKAARFAALRNESVRLGGIPVFAVLAGLGWRRTTDALGPVVRDTDGRAFTVKTLNSILTVEPLPSLVNTALDESTS